MSTTNDGISATDLAKRLPQHSYETAWTMLHKIRTACQVTFNERLLGQVDLGVAPIRHQRGPARDGRPGIGRTPVAIAVERPTWADIGRVRLLALSDTHPSTLRAFMEYATDDDAQIRTSAATHFTSPPNETTVDQASSIDSLDESGSPDTAIRLVSARIDQWISSTYQGAVEPSHLQAYLDEWCFRFNLSGTPDIGTRFFRLVERSVHTGPMPRSDTFGPARDKPEMPGRDAHTNGDSVAESPKPQTYPWRKDPRVDVADGTPRRP